MAKQKEAIHKFALRLCGHCKKHVSGCKRTAEGKWMCPECKKKG